MLVAPRCDVKDTVLLTKITRGRRDNGALGHRQLAARLNRAANILLADEVQGRLTEVRLLPDSGPTDPCSPFANGSTELRLGAITSSTTFRLQADSRPTATRWKFNIRLRLIASRRQKPGDPARQGAGIDPRRGGRTLRGRRQIVWIPHVWGRYDTERAGCRTVARSIPPADDRRHLVC